MSRPIFGYPIQSDAWGPTYTPTLSGGDWLTALPLGNLQDERLHVLARSTDTELSSTVFQTDLGVSRDVRVFGLVNHNLSTAAKVRVLGEVDDLLFDYEAGNDPSLLAGYAFSRADATTCATYQDRNGIVRTVAANVLRDAHFIGGVRTTLLEPSRQNICLQSQALDVGATWSCVRCSVSANADTGPDGIASADRLIVDNTAASSHRAGQVSLTITANANVALSIYAKQGAGAQGVGFMMLMADSTSVDFAGKYFNLLTGAVAGSITNGTGTVVGSGIKAVGSTGWYHCWVVVNIGNGRTNAYFTIYNVNAAVDAFVFDGDGASYVSLWGAQIENNASFPTSYIATTTTAVTRAADSTLDFSAVAAGTYHEKYYDLATAAYVEGVGVYAAGAINLAVSRAHVLYRIMTGTQVLATMQAAVYDSGWLDGWPSGLSVEDAQGWTPTWFHVASTAQSMRYPWVQIDDYANADGYVEGGRLVVASGYQPTVQVVAGAKVRWVDPSISQTTDGGAKVFYAKRKHREWALVFEELPTAEIRDSILEMHKHQGTTGQLFFVYDPEETTTAHQVSFLCTMRELGALEQRVYPRGNTQFVLEEVL